MKKKKCRCTVNRRRRRIVGGNWQGLNESSTPQDEGRVLCNPEEEDVLNQSKEQLLFSFSSTFVQI